MATIEQDSKGPARQDRGASDTPDKIVIRVIDAHRSLLDISAASIEEITTTLEKIAESTPELGRHQQSLLGIVNIAELMQGPIRPFLAGHGHAPIAEIVARELFSTGTLIPIIKRTRSNRQPIERGSSKQSLRLRPSRRISAIYQDGTSASVAAEEFVDLIGVAPRTNNALRFAHFMCHDVYNMPWIGKNHIKSGNSGFPGAAVSSLHPIPPLIPPELSPAMLAFAEREEAGKTLIKLMKQMSLSVSFVMGPGVSAAMSSIAINSQKSDQSDDITDAVTEAVVVSAPAVKPDEEPREDLRFLLWRLSKIRSDLVANDPQSWHFDLSPLYDLSRARAFDPYLQVLTRGRESAESFLEAESARQTQSQFASAQAKKTFRQMGMAAQYIQIIEDKLGATRANQMRDEAGGSPDRILASLSPKERATVKMEYENRMEMWKARIGNKCPHVRIESRMRSSATAVETARQLRTLLEFEKMRAPEKKSKPQDWIYCRNCNFRLICPHLKDKIILEARKSPYEEIRSRLLRYAARSTSSWSHSGETNITEYYCRICGEQIGDAIEDDTAEILGRFGNLDEPLRTVIWAETANAVEDVHFQVPIDPRQFASASVGALYNVVLTFEKPSGHRPRAALVSTPSDADEIPPMTRLNIILAVYAYILNLMQSPKSDLRFENVRPGAKIGAVMDAMIARIVVRHGGLISRMEDVSQEFILGRFQELFRTVKGLGGDMHLRSVNAEEELWRQLTQIDPLYHYATRSARVFGALPPHDAAGRFLQPEAQRKEFEVAMGAPLPQLVKNARANAKNPELSQLYSKKLVVQIPPDTTLEFLYKSPEVNMFAKMFRPKFDERLAREFLALADDSSIADPLANFSETTGGKKPDKSLKPDKSQKRAGFNPTRSSPLAKFDYGLVAISYDLLAEYETTLHNREAEKKYLARLEPVLRAEHKYLQLRRELAAHPKISFDFKAQQFKLQPIHIGMLFDENGFRHDWSIFVMSTGDEQHSRTIELRQKGVLRAIETGELTNAKLIDVKCGVCGITQTQADTLDESKIRESLRLSNQMDTFFLFYESRCPEGNLHAWLESSTCRKCGIRAGLLQARKTESSQALAAIASESRDYFDRYIRKFDADKQIMSEALAKVEIQEEISRSAPVDMSGWKYDYGIVSKAADLANAMNASKDTPVTPALIESMGAMEGRTYADVLDGKNAPPPPASIDDGRITAIASIVRGFIMEYNRLRFLIKELKPSQFLLETIEKAGVPKHEWEQMSHSLPTIGTDFTAKFRAIIDETAERGGSRPPLDVVNFGIEYLCQMVLQLVELHGAQPHFAKVAHLFAIEALKMFLRQEKLLCKPGRFNFSIFTQIDMDENAVELGVDVGDTTEDVLESIVAASGEEEAFDPFSLESMDYDGHNDEPD